MSEEMTVIANGQEIRYEDIPGYPGYRVGSDGTVWSKHSRFGHGSREEWRPLKQTLKSNGYFVVGLRKESEQRMRGKVDVLYVHRLVLRIFVGPCPKGMEVLHGDGDSKNNRIENLRYGTRQENVDDCLRHGTRPKGSRSGSSRLHEEDIPIIRKLHRRGFTMKKIANFYEVGDETIRAIILGRTWSHVKDGNA